MTFTVIDHTRHSGIFNAVDTEVVLIGAGGIGAITAITLGKMGVGRLDIFDDDTVDEVNLATQFHRLSDVGLFKAITVAQIVDSFAGFGVASHSISRFDEDHVPPPADIYISAVDSIKSRQGIWKAIDTFIDIENKYQWYLDARMGAEIFELYVVNLAKRNWYRSQIDGQNDDDFLELPCTSKATIYTACIAAGHIGAAVRRIITGQQDAGFLTHNILDNQISFLEI